MHLQEELLKLDRDVPHGAVDEASGRVPLVRGFALPSGDLSDLLSRIGSKLLVRDHTLVEYLAWSERSGLFRFMATQGVVTVATVCQHTRLTERGADALLGVLCGLRLATRSPAGQYTLTATACEYLLPGSPFYVADQLRSRVGDIPRAYVPGRDGLLWRVRLRFLGLLPGWRFGSPVRLRNQHARNLPACAAAVRTGEFAKVRCLVDIAGGSGTLSIPLALEYPEMRIVLTELPRALPNVRPFLVKHGLEDRIELRGVDVFSYPWPLPSCDGIFIGNFLHGFDDERCSRVCREAFERLAPGGKIWVHEMIWNENKDGPLMTAMCNATMRSGGTGRQRTATELMSLLRSAGFVSPYVVPTAGAFALVAARKPR